MNTATLAVSMASLFFGLTTSTHMVTAAERPSWKVVKTYDDPLEIAQFAQNFMKEFKPGEDMNSPSKHLVRCTGACIHVYAMATAGFRISKVVVEHAEDFRADSYFYRIYYTHVSGRAKHLEAGIQAPVGLAL